jgi:hypothetical protein
VLVAVTIGGNTMGVLGIILAVPACAVVYTLLRETVYKRLKQKKEAEAPKTESEESQKKEKATGTLLSLFGTPSENRTHNCPLGVHSPCESLIKSVHFRAFRCVFIKNARFFILKISLSVT